MKVQKTLGEIYSDLNDLYEERDFYRKALADVVANDDLSDEYLQNLQKKYVKSLKNVNETIRYTTAIEVKYEDKYESEED